MKKSILTLTIFVIAIITGFAQGVSKNQVAGNLVVYGTSNLHDWDVKAGDISGNATFQIDNGVLKSISKLNFIVKAESLKSGKSGMDKNTYAALNTKAHKNITYSLSRVSKITETATNTYSVETTGNLTISGTTKPITINFIAKTTGNKLSLNGVVSLDMTHYGITPPTALMGTVKTGKDVRIEFDIEYK